MTIVLQVIQVLASVALIICIVLQTTKSEQSGGGGGLGWGIIGGKSSASIRTRWGVEEHLDRLTTYAAVAFLSASLLAAIARLAR
jgi:protein translocase SecG subunit